MALTALVKRLYSWFKSRHFGRSSVDKRYALAEACLIGVLSGLSALFIKEGIGWVGTWRLHLANQFGAVIVLPTAGLIFGLLAGWILETFSTAAAGGGIPQVKAALAGFPIPLSLRVALVKAVGTILVLGAGLTLGRRAPTVHIGAALAAQLSSWLPTSPEHRRQMIAAGAAAGLAAGFNTPIAGVLFVIEELMRDVSSLTLETAILASFIGAVVSRVLGAANLNIVPDLSQQSHFLTADIPFYLLLGIIAGVLGGLFNRGMMFTLWVNRRLNWHLSWRIGLVGLISGIIIAFLPPFFRDNAGLRELVITGELSWQTILLAFIAHFFLTIIAYSSGAPGGLLAPALVMGSALGYLLGTAKIALMGTGSAHLFALAGMGAFFTSVVRVPVTAIVIVFELTENFNLVLPLMISCAVSYLVAENVYPGSIYQHLLEASGIQLKDDSSKKDFLAQLTAVDVMQSQVETLASDLTLNELIQAMSKSSHRGFPVVEGGKLIGIITQSDLAKFNAKSGDTLLKVIMTPNPIAVNPDTSLSDVLYLLNRYQLSRLPVTEGAKLIGIITRSDIIRTEAQHIGGGKSLAFKPVPSYIVYQTRSPATGKGRILLPIANPETMPALLQMAAAIARHHDYEVECLQVIKVPKHSFPSETRVNVQASRKLMQRVERFCRQGKIPVHTQVRVAQDTAEAILETIRDRHIKLMLMGWKGSTSTQGAIFGDVADTLIRQAPCELLLVKLGSNADAYPHHLNDRATWLIPMAGGPNIQRAMALLPAMLSLYPHSYAPELCLCKVYLPIGTDSDYTDLDKAAQSLKEKVTQPIMPIPLCSRSIPDAVIHLAQSQRCGVILLGASQEGLLQHVIHGNIPEAIARGVDSTVILVRGAIS